MNDFPIVILIRWILDFKCNFIVGNHIATKFCTTAVPCAKFHKDHFPNLVWEQHEISIEFELRLKNREMRSSCIDSCWLALVFGMGLPQIIAIRKYFVDTMRNYVIILLRLPDVMCKFDLIKPLNNNKHCGNMYIMCGNTHYSVINPNLLVSRNCQAKLS